MTTERAPAYAGHQEHRCPVCLNVHGGRTGYLWDCPNCGQEVETFIRPPTLEAAEPAPLDADLLRGALEASNYRDMRYTNIDRQVERIRAEYARLAAGDTAASEGGRRTEGKGNDR